MAAINFFTQSLPFKLSQPRKTSSWIKSAIESERFILKGLNYIFCSDQELLELNRTYLRHDTYTDIITFDNSEANAQVEGEIYISIERVRENASDLQIPFEQELRRVMIHGVLHLMGYRDKSSAQKAQMREKEDAYLSLYPA